MVERDSLPAPDLCSTCSDPGHCCRRFYLATREPDEINKAGGLRVRSATTKLEALITMARKGWPFLPLAHAPFEVEGEPIDAWLFTCPMLDDAGRCIDYENRPQLCRDFEAGSDPLCVYHEATAYA